MVILNFLSIIRRVTYQTTTILFLLVSMFLILLLSFILIKTLIVRIKSFGKMKILDMLYRYMLSEITLGKIHYRFFQRDIIIESFTIIISSITGKKQRRMKNAIRALGLIKTIEKRLFSIFPGRRIRSCQLLGVLESKSSVQILSRALFDLNPKVTSAAIIALGEIKEVKTVPSLLTFFKQCSLPHAWLVAAILPFFGNKIYKYIKPYLKPEILPKDKLMLLIKVIAHFRLSESLEELKILYDHTDDIDIRINTLSAIGKINDLFSVKTVIDALSAHDWQFRAIACNIIGEMSIKGAAYRLIPLLKDKNWFVRRNAAEALVNLGKIGIMTLLAYLEIDDQYARDMIVQTLEENGIVEDAVNNIRNSDTTKQAEAIKIIKTLIQKGYKEYLDNYRDVNEIIRSKVSESAND